jgi:hypothetical protein
MLQLQLLIPKLHLHQLQLLQFNLLPQENQYLLPMMVSLHALVGAQKLEPLKIKVKTLKKNRKA